MSNSVLQKYNRSKATKHRNVATSRFIETSAVPAFAALHNAIVGTGKVQVKNFLMRRTIQGRTTRKSNPNAR